MPPEIDIVEAPNRTNNALEDLFKEAPVVDSIPEPKPEPEPEPEPEPQPEPEPEIEEEEQEEETETDYDAPDAKDEPLTESKAVEQAKLKGREAKELKARLTEKELETERISKERDDLAARLSEVEATKINPREHPEFKELLGEANKYIRTTADTIPGDSDSYVKNFGTLITSYMDLPDRGAARTEKMEDFRASVVDTLKLSDIPYAELDADEKKAYHNDVRDVIKALQGNVDRTQKLIKMEADLSEKAKNGHLAVGVKAYEAISKELSDAFAVVGDLPDEVLEASPYAVGSIVAKMVKDSPEMEKRLKAAQRDALELIAGPRVYTQAELDKLQANGINIKEHNAERLRLHKEKQKKLGKMFIEGVVIRADYMKLKKEYDELKAGKDAEESESDALIATTKKKAPKKEVEVYVPAAERRNKALDEMLGGG